VNKIFAKSAVAAGVVAALSYGTSSEAVVNPQGTIASATTDIVTLGCTVPGNGAGSATASTVYSVDATSSVNSTFNISLPSTVAVGVRCSSAIAALGALAVTSGSRFGASAANGLGATGGVVTQPVVQTIPGLGYTLQTFTFVNTATQNSVPLNPGIGFIGTNATGNNNNGATVYSVDAGNQTNSTSITNLTGLLASPATSALATASSTSGFGTAAGAYPVGQVNLTLPNGYSLNQYTFQ